MEEAGGGWSEYAGRMSAGGGRRDAVGGKESQVPCEEMQLESLMMTKMNGSFYGEHSGLITNTPKKQL